MHLGQEGDCAGCRLAEGEGRSITGVVEPLQEETVVGSVCSIVVAGQEGVAAREGEGLGDLGVVAGRPVGVEQAAVGVVQPHLGVEVVAIVAQPNQDHIPGAGCEGVGKHLTRCCDGSGDDLAIGNQPCIFIGFINGWVIYRYHSQEPAGSGHI